MLLTEILNVNRQRELFMHDNNYKFTNAAVL